MNNHPIAVIGTGAGGLSMAAHLSIKGLTVNLFSRSEKRVLELTQNPVRVTGVIEGEARVNLITSDARAAVSEASLIVVTVPGQLHRSIAALFSDCLVDGQTVLLCPGRMLGAIEFEQAIRMNGCKADITIAECQTMPHTCRNRFSEIIDVLAVKSNVRLATYPACRTATLCDDLNQLLPVFKPVAHILETGLNSVGAILHPLPMLMNLGWIESPVARFTYYYQGITPSVARVMEKIDGERIAIGEKLSVVMISLREWLSEVYGSQGGSLLEAIHNTKSYSTIEAPETVQHRYFLEDVPTGLVPLSSLGDLVGVETPFIDAAIVQASEVCGIDFMTNGRTMSNLGMNNLSPQSIIPFVTGSTGNTSP